MAEPRRVTAMDNIEHDLEGIDSADVDWRGTAENLQREITRMKQARTVIETVTVTVDDVPFDLAIDEQSAAEFGKFLRAIAQQRMAVGFGYDEVEDIAAQLDGRPA